MAELDKSDITRAALVILRHKLGQVEQLTDEEWAERKRRVEAEWAAREAEIERRKPLERAFLAGWGEGLSARVQNAVCNALGPGGIVELTPEAVRAKGAGWWMRQPNFGRKSEKELGEAIGGWETDQPGVNTEALRRELAAIKTRLVRIEALLEADYTRSDRTF